MSLGLVSIAEAQAAVDGATLGLLFGMMVLSAALEVSGAFALLGFWLTRRARSPLVLLVTISIAAALLSAFFINNVVCIAFTPLVLEIADALERDPTPYLVALATSSNIGSVATITGNPQNILIGSISRISYARFAAALAPIALLALAANVAIVALVFRRALGPRFEARPESAAAARLRALDSQERHRHRGRARRVPRRRPARRRGPPRRGGDAPLARGQPEAALRARRLDAARAFTGLFVVVGGVEKAGLADRMPALLAPLRSDTVWGLTAVTAILSNVVSNVPAVMVLKSAAPRLGHGDGPWLTLAMASTLGGNLTLPGSLATIIVVERAQSRVRSRSGTSPRSASPRRW